MDKHVPCKRGGIQINDRGNFHVTTYSSSFNDVRRKPTCYSVNSNSYALSLKPYVRFPVTSEQNDSGCELDQFLSTTYNDFKPFRFTQEPITIPNLLLKSKLSNECNSFQGKVTKDDSVKPKFNPLCDKKLQYASQSGFHIPGHSLSKNEENIDIITNYYKNQHLPLTNFTVTCKDYTNQFLLRPVDEIPNIEKRSNRVTGNTREIPLSGESWFPFDCKIEKSTSNNYYKRVQPLSKRVIKELKRDPCRIINSSYPRLVSMHQVSYPEPYLNHCKIGKDLATPSHNSLQSAYSMTMSDNLYDNNNYADYCSETAMEFTNRLPNLSSAEGYLGNVSRVGTNFSRI